MTTTLTGFQKAEIAVKNIHQLRVDRMAAGDFTPEVEAFWDREVRINRGVFDMWAWFEAENWGALAPNQLGNAITCVLKLTDTDDDIRLGMTLAAVDMLRQAGVIF